MSWIWDKIACLVVGVIAFASCTNCSSNVRLTEEDMSAYLMVYFKDATHGLHMALSTDGYTFTDVNNAKPVIAGDTIALQKGIRDPHIFRGPNGMFYWQ